MRHCQLALLSLLLLRPAPALLRAQVTIDAERPIARERPVEVIYEGQPTRRPAHR